MEEMEDKPIEKREHPFSMVVRQMLKEQNIEYTNPQVVAKLTWVAENMAVQLFKDIKYNSELYNEIDSDGLAKHVTLAIAMRNQDEPGVPIEDTLIHVAVAVNGNPLVATKHDGLALPNDNLGNENFQLYNPFKKVYVPQWRKIIFLHPTQSSLLKRFPSQKK